MVRHQDTVTLVNGWAGSTATLPYRGLSSRGIHWLLVLSVLFNASVVSAAVLRIELVFADGSQLITVEQGAQLRAKAKLTIQQPTLIRGRWEFSGPLSAHRFERLKLIQQMVGGSGIETLLSPLLPTAVTGRYRLRLCLQEVCDKAVQLTYAVFPPK